MTWNSCRIGWFRSFWVSGCTSWFRVSSSGLRFGRIRWDLVDIWPDPPRSHWILKDLDYISTDLNEIMLDLFWISMDWGCDHTTIGLVRFSSGFGTQNRNWTYTFQDLTSETRCCPRVALNGLSLVQVAPGRLVPAGHQFTWTAILHVYSIKWITKLFNSKEKFTKLFGCNSVTRL